MSRLFVHGQLPEVIFPFAGADCTLTCRLLCKDINTVVFRYAEMMMKDVVGFEHTNPLESWRPAIDGPPPRFALHEYYIRLVLITDGAIGKLIASSTIKRLGLMICESEHAATGNALVEAVSNYCMEATERGVEGPHLPGLVELNLNWLTPSTPLLTTFVTNSPNLQRFTSSHWLSGTALGILGRHCAKLQRVKIPFSQGLLESSMDGFPSQCNFLEVFDVSETNGHITDTSISHVAMNCPNLRSLNVHNTYGVTDKSIELVARNCPHLEFLDVGDTRQITDASVTLIANFCANLQSLRLNSTNLITDATLQVVAAKCKHLRELDVSQTSSFSDSGISAIGTSCTELQHLNVGGTLDISDTSITIVAANCKQLRSFSAIATRESITEVSVAALAANCPRLEELCLQGNYGTIRQEVLDLLPSGCRVFQ